MRNKIVCISVCMLLITTALPVIGAVNSQTDWSVKEKNYYEPDQNTPANPGLIGIRFFAKVYEVDDPNNLLGGVIAVNDVITGKYVYDTGISDSYPDDISWGYYDFTSSSCGIEVKAGGLTFKTNPNDIDYYIHILNNYPDFGDGYSIWSESNLQLSNGMVADTIVFGLRAKDATAIDSDALPATAPVLADWPDDKDVSLYGYDPNNPSNDFRITANITIVIKNNKIDTYDAEGNLVTFIPAIPYSCHQLFVQFWEKFSELFPLAFPLLR